MEKQLILVLEQAIYRGVCHKVRSATHTHTDESMSKAHMNQSKGLPMARAVYNLINHRKKVILDNNPKNKIENINEPILI